MYFGLNLGLTIKGRKRNRVLITVFVILTLAVTSSFGGKTDVALRDTGLSWDPVEDAAIEFFSDYFIKGEVHRAIDALPEEQWITEVGQFGGPEGTSTQGAPSAAVAPPASSSATNLQVAKQALSQCVEIGEKELEENSPFGVSMEAEAQVYEECRESVSAEFGVTTE